jgi:hypothetical protein
MKGLTIHQPWAWLIEGQHKLYETRSWATRYRGLVAIHAGRHWNNQTRDWAQMTALGLGIEMPQQLPLGAIVAVCELKAIYKTELLYPKLDMKERKLGDYEAGRFAWRLEVQEVFSVPVFCAGQQGLWECDLAGLRAKAIEASYGKV